MKKKFQKFLPRIVGAQINSLHLLNKRKAANKAYQIFCTPRRGRVQEHQKDFLEKAKDQIVNAEGLDLQTYSWPGNGKTILLIHGWESNTNRWQSLVDRLQAQNYNIVAFDAPAHGYSQGSILHIPLYSKCLQVMINHFAPHYLIGHSIGGMTTIYNQYCNANQEIEKLVVLGPPSELTQIMGDYQQILRLKPQVMQSLEALFNERLGYYFTDFSIAKFSKEINKKGLLIHDKFDKIAPITASEAIAQNWQDAILFKTEGAGHSLYHDKIDRKIIEFLN